MSPKPRRIWILPLLCLTVAVALGVMATLIHAQGDALAATPLNYNDSRPGTLSFTSPRVAYAFAGSQNDLVTVEVSPLASGVDPKVTLLDPTGQILMQNDNGAFSGQPDSFLSLFLPQTGFYTLIVESASSTTGDFLIHLTGRAPVKSHRLEFGVPVEVDVRTDPLPVYFTFKADADCPTTLTVYNISAGTPYTFPFAVIVRDEDGTPVEQLQGGRMTENRMTVHNEPDTAPTAGLYEVEVTSADPAVAGSLFLVVTCADQEPACFVPPGLVGTPTPETPTPPPPTYDPCNLSEIILDGPDGPVIISGQNDYSPGQKLVPEGGSGKVELPGNASLTPSPTIAATPCASPTPPCLSAAEQASTALASTSQAILATWAAGGISQSDEQATGVAQVATVNAIKTQVALNPQPCEPTVIPCPTEGISLVPPNNATKQALIDAGCATPVVTPCAVERGQLVTAAGATAIALTAQAAGCATPGVTPCPTGDSRQVAIPRFETEIAQTAIAQGQQPAAPCATPTCSPEPRIVDADGRATLIAMGCATPRPTPTLTPSPTCPPFTAAAVLPCQQTPPPVPDCTPVAATVAVVQCATPTCPPSPAGAVVPCATPTCPPSPAGAVVPCNPSPTPTCTQIPGIAAVPCCPTPGAVAGVATPAGDLGILVPCVTPTATPSPTATRPLPPPAVLDCGNFALTSPTDGLPNGGVTVYWNPVAGATGYRVNVYNDSNQLKLSVTVGAGVTSVGIDVSEGSVGPGYTFTIQVQALFNGRVGCTSSKTENRAAPPGGGGNDGGDKPKPTCSPLGVAAFPCK